MHKEPTQRTLLFVLKQISLKILDDITIYDLYHKFMI